MANNKKTTKETPGEERFLATGKNVTLLKPAGGAKKTAVKKKSTKGGK